jgi:hypothetical protein
MLFQALSRELRTIEEDNGLLDDVRDLIVAVLQGAAVFPNCFHPVEGVQYLEHLTTSISLVEDDLHDQGDWVVKPHAQGPVPVLSFGFRSCHDRLLAVKRCPLSD